jgi:hypothetical protein
MYWQSWIAIVVESTLNPLTDYLTNKALIPSHGDKTIICGVQEMPCPNLRNCTVGSITIITKSMKLSHSWEVTELVKKFRVFNGAQSLIILFTRICHWSLFWAKLILPHPLSLRSIFILPSHLHLLHLDLPSDLFPPGFPTKISYASHLSHAC